MALVTVEGIFRDGKVELAETPAGVDGETRVLVTFLPAPETVPGADRTISEPSPRKAAIDRVMKRMKEGIPLGGPPYPKREELYDRVERLIRRNG